MADTAIQNTVFSENRGIGTIQRDRGLGLLSSLARARGNQSGQAAGIAAGIRDRFETGTNTPSFGALRVANGIGTALTGGASPDGLGNAARLYEAARPQMVRQGLLFNDNTRASPFRTLTDDLVAGIRTDITATGATAQSVETIRQAAQLYRLTMPGINRQAGLLPATTLFGANTTDTVGAIATSTFTGLDRQLNASPSSESSSGLTGTARLYLSTGYRLFQTPQLLLDIFA